MKRFDDLLDTSEALDLEQLYREMLNDTYGGLLRGPFEFMEPAKILEEFDPVAYRCGLADFLVCRRLRSRILCRRRTRASSLSCLESIREELDYELNAEIDELQNDLDDYDFAGVDEETGEGHRECVENQIRIIRAEIDSLYRLF